LQEGEAEMTTLEPLRFKRILIPVDESKPSQNQPSGDVFSWGLRVELVSG
jgi:hypothetical protein